MLVISSFCSGITMMIFHVIGCGLSPCGNYDIFYIFVE
jgi:hypothetical protein